MSVILLLKVRDQAKKFINKVDTGRARSRETYADFSEIVEEIETKYPLQVILHDKQIKSQNEE